MKKMFNVLVLLVVFIGALSAFEPKIECATIDKRGNVQYNESYGMDLSGRPYNRSFKIKKSGKFIYGKSGSLGLLFYDLNSYRTQYEAHSYLSKVKPYHACSLCEFLNKFKSDYENNILNETEKKQYENIIKLHEARGCVDDGASGSYNEWAAKNDIKKAVENIPFINETNFLSISETEWKEKMYEFYNKVLNKK